MKLYHTVYSDLSPKAEPILLKIVEEIARSSPEIYKILINFFKALHGFPKKNEIMLLLSTYSNS